MIGLFISAQNSFYRLSLSYDIESDVDVKLQRGLLNADFKFKPLIGFGVGAVSSSYALNGKAINQSNGVLAFRAGTEYLIDKSNSLEFLLEYSHTLTSRVGKSFNDGIDFTTYNIDNQNAIMFRIGYSFEF